MACCPVIIGRWHFCQQDSVIGRKPQCDFEEYANSKCHKEAVERSFTLPNVLKNVGESLSKQHPEQKRDNRDCFLGRCLGVKNFEQKQNISIRGKQEGLMISTSELK